MTGVTPTGLGSRPTGGAANASPAKPSIPNAAFTPGPWLIHAKHRWVVPAEDAFKEPDDALPICELRDPDERLTEDETLANGFLIAASPKLYKYLELALVVLDRSNTFWGGYDNAVVALAEARGETA